MSPGAYMYLNNSRKVRMVRDIASTLKLMLAKMILMKPFLNS